MGKGGKGGPPKKGGYNFIFGKRVPSISNSPREEEEKKRGKDTI